MLACGSVALEIGDRQIWQLMAKPLGRLNCLIGKWLGVVSINLVILVVAGVSTFTFVQYLRAQPVASRPSAPCRGRGRDGAGQAEWAWSQAGVPLCPAGPSTTNWGPTTRHRPRAPLSYRGFASTASPLGCYQVRPSA